MTPSSSAHAQSDQNNCSRTHNIAEIDTPAQNLAEMARPKMTLPLTLILAATPSLGIGTNGGLPWPMLKSEMAYFARVTKRVPRPRVSQPPDTLKTMNAVVMGRKTWDSIPKRFRPLAGRINVVVSRAGVVDVDDNGEGTTEKKIRDEGPIVVGSLVEAVDLLASGTLKTNIRVGRTFVIGGASLYKAALETGLVDTVLLTKIHKEFECDTFFSVDLERESDWKRASCERLREFVGEEGGLDGVVEEKGLRFEFCLFERRNRDKGNE